jgi:hypothetical protein
MSIISFLTRLWNSIRSLFNKLPATVRNAVHIGVSVTENIKKFVESPLADVLTTIIPGDIDDKIKQALRAGLPIILTDLKLAQGMGTMTDPQEITRCAIQALQKLDGEIKNAYLHNLSVFVAQLAADGKLSWSDGVCIVEWYYQHKFRSLKTAA